MYILGLNAYHGDSSACLIKDGELIAAAEEERFRRVKHWAGLPTEAIRFCLEFAGISFADVDYIALAKDSRAHFWNKVWYAVRTVPNPKLIFDRIRGFKKSSDIADDLGAAFDENPNAIQVKIRRVEHHKAHLASTFFVSPFREATLVSLDGLGDFVSTMWGYGDGNKMEIYDFVLFPHSIGFFYTAITQYLGFWKYGDEYKMMGLSAFGKPTYMDKMREIVRLEQNGKFTLNLKYFRHHKENTNLEWEAGAPEIGQMFSKKLEGLLGPARKKGEKLNNHFKDIAASAQAMYEEVFFNILKEAYRRTGNDTLCFAGGTAQNSLANGKIFQHSPFKQVYIPPAPHDAGTSLGAAYYLYYHILEKPYLPNDRFIMETPFWGAGYSDTVVERVLKGHGLQYRRLSDAELIKQTAQLIADGNIVGWFQGRFEWGPRALGNRSILANPTLPGMKDTINLKIKKREPFRPFAPSILEERVSEYFEEVYPVPFMEKVYMIKENKQVQLPAVVHVDGTGRLQTVSREFNPRYYDLIKAFGNITGVPIILNTSFNENEPIVNTPQEAINCFLRTDMDILVINNFLIDRKGARGAL